MSSAQRELIGDPRRRWDCVPAETIVKVVITATSNHTIVAGDSVCFPISKLNDPFVLVFVNWIFWCLVNKFQSYLVIFNWRILRSNNYSLLYKKKKE